MGEIRPSEKLKSTSRICVEGKINFDTSPTEEDSDFLKVAFLPS